MSSDVALRSVLVASIALGVVDVVWINVALVPDVTANAQPGPVATTVLGDEQGAREIEPTIEPTREPTVDLAVAPTVAPTVDPAIELTGEPTVEPMREPPREPTREPTLEPKPVYFASRSATLDDEAREVLRSFVRALPADALLAIEGYADRRGDESRNRELSKDRAKAVARELVMLGVAQSRVRVRYFGETKAAHTETWRDRRVEIEIISGGTR